MPWKVRSVAVALMLGTSGGAYAATEAAADNSPTEANEIIVTGEKFDRTIQETTTSVNVTTAETIQQQNLLSVYDIIDRTANLTSTYDRSGFTIRGISNSNISGTGIGDLATVYLDGSPLVREALDNGPLDLWDLEQVEIFRGPQSTLQGRNALAGSIVLKTADPGFDFTGKARAILMAKTGERRFAAALGGPIVDDLLAFRVSGEVSRADGLIRNPTLGIDADRSKADTFRAKLLLTPDGEAGRLRVLVSYLYDKHLSGSDYSIADQPDY